MIPLASPLSTIGTRGMSEGREIVGTVFIRAAAHRSGEDGEGPYRCEISTHVLRSIRKGRAFLTAKNECTWVRSGVGKSAQWGWAASVPDYYRTAFLVSEGPPSGFAKSESQAIRSALTAERQRLARTKDAEMAGYAAERVTCLERRLAMAMKAKSLPQPLSQDTPNG